MIQDINNIVILTGAGISAESGLETFRTQGAKTLWGSGQNSFAVEEMCIPVGQDHRRRPARPFIFL